MYTLRTSDGLMVAKINDQHIASALFSTMDGHWKLGKSGKRCYVFDTDYTFDASVGRGCATLYIWVGMYLVEE